MFKLFQNGISDRHIDLNRSATVTQESVLLQQIGRGTMLNGWENQQVW